MHPLFPYESFGFNEDYPVPQQYSLLFFTLYHVTVHTPSQATPEKEFPAILTPAIPVGDCGSASGQLRDGFDPYA
jgi:hypothetical protein